MTLALDFIPEGQGWVPSPPLIVSLILPGHMNTPLPNVDNLSIVEHSGVYSANTSLPLV
jgi:hypothetical protein